jgi:hypothetical protein
VEEIIGQVLFDYLSKPLLLRAAGELMHRAAWEFKQGLVHLKIELSELHGRL